MISIVELIENYHRNNNFEPILQYYKFYIKYLARRFNIEEYSPNISIKLWTIVSEIKVDRFENNSSIDSFIKKCLRNYAINLFRKYVESNLIIYNDEILNIEGSKIKNSKELDIESNINFYDLIKKLPKIQREIIALRYDKGFSDKEISKLLGITRQAVYKSRKKAIESLRHCI